MPTVSAYEWLIKQKKLAIVKPSASSDSLSASGSGDTVRYSGPSYPTPFEEGNLEQESEIPSQFHSVLVSYVLMSYFEELGDDKKAAIYRFKWKEGILEGRIMADDDRQTGAVDIMAHDF